MRMCLKNVSVSFGEKEILKNINFEVNTKDKIAIVGRNGSGKTTLLKVITGQQEIDSSYKLKLTDRIQKTGKAEIGYLKQIAFENDNISLEKELLKSYQNIIELKDKIETLEQNMIEGTSVQNVDKYENMLRSFDLLGGNTYQKEYNQALKKFGFSEEDKVKKLSEFSGGQKTKIALLKLLLSKPDLLVLDEPTNHLDIIAIKWLENFLLNYPKAIIVVSHDRAFLDKFVNIVYEIERNSIQKYIGNYSEFAKQKMLNFEKQLKEYNSYVKEKDRLQSLADRFRYKATKASMAQSKLKQIARMHVIEKPLEADTKEFALFIKPKIESGNEVLCAENIEIGYDHVLSKVNFKIFKGDKIGVVGGNGFGKSTLLKSLVGKIPLLKGKIKLGTNVEIGYFDQQTTTNNISNETILENFLNSFPDEDEESARNILGSFLFLKEDVFKSLKDLSGGELVRLELCKIFKHKPNFLILDEPTNHMDIIGKEALEKMLQSYEGTLIFVSHDRYFVNKIAQSLIVFENGKCKFLKNTSYSEYENMIHENNNINNNINCFKNNVKNTETKNTNSYFLNKEKSRIINKRNKLETKINELEKQISNLTQSLENPEICSDYIMIIEVQNEIDLINAEMERLIAEWISLT